MSSTKDEIVGAPASAGVATWVYVSDGGLTYGLHADASRAAVARYLELVDTNGEDLEWTPVPNQRGKLNAIAYGPEKLRLTAFYFYLEDP